MTNKIRKLMEQTDAADCFDRPHYHTTCDKDGTPRDILTMQCQRCRNGQGGEDR